MNYFNGFLQNLSSGYTTMLISFLIGYIIGVTKVGNNSVLLGLLIGIIFAIFSGLTNSFIDTVLPNNVTISVNVKFIYAILLILLFFFVVSSAFNLDRMIARF